MCILFHARPGYSRHGTITTEAMPGLSPFLPALQLPARVCTNCGFWQRFSGVPQSCPICLDSRHVPPMEGWEFRSFEEARERYPCHMEELLSGIFRIWNDPVEGIGPNCYLCTSESGNFLFEGTTVFSSEILERIRELGGVSFVSSSHPHSYGALWQIEEVFKPELIMHPEDYSWAGAFQVTWPFDDSLQFTERFSVLHSGVHFAGHTFAFDKQNEICFCGDSLKFKCSRESPRTARSVSSHKAFVRGVPITREEASQYHQVFSRIQFSKTFTPFEQVFNFGYREALKLFDLFQNGRPSSEFVSLEFLQESNNHDHNI